MSFILRQAELRRIGKGASYCLRLRCLDKLMGFSVPRNEAINGKLLLDKAMTHMNFRF